MEKSNLRQIIIDHQEILGKKEEDLIPRDVEMDFYLKGNEVVIITGIRRCGKSTLLKIIAEKLTGTKLYLDFDDIRLTDFTIENFQDIEDIAYQLFGTHEIVYFFDEIQNAPYWERWVNNLYSRNRKVFLTGSNSRLLSSEISTFLTGRNKVLKLYPFSFREYLRLKGIHDLENLSSKSRSEIFRYFIEFFDQGGFPLINRNDDVGLSKNYFEDILNKDIFTRYRIKHIKEVKDLVVYLFSNAGKKYSYSTLKVITGIKSLSTLKNYIDYLKNVFLIFTIDKFDYSVKKQKVSSSKVYVSDNSFFKTISFNFSENAGRRLENIVFLQLLRKGKEIYYHQGKRECDFIIKTGLDVTSAFQVCLDPSDPKTRRREIEGLEEAMRKYKLSTGTLLTMDHFESTEEGKIMFKPVWKWLLEE